jgi:hypothetical protein
VRAVTLTTASRGAMLASMSGNPIAHRVALPPDLDGFRAWWTADHRVQRRVEVTHLATGIRGAASAFNIDTALAAALKLCRARLAMARRERHPLPLVRDVDATTPDGASALRAMLDGDVATR